MSMFPGITEFTELDPQEFHLVKEGAAGFPVLVAKASAEVNEAIDNLGSAGELTKARWSGFCGWEPCTLCKEAFGDRYEVLLAKAKLKSKARAALPDSAFALPESREYPIHDENHARAALSMLHNASPEQQSKIKAAVHRRYPDIGEGDDVKNKVKKEGTSQESEEAKPIPPESAAQVQSHAVDGQQGPVHIDVLPDGTHIHVPSFSGAPAPSQSAEGHGTTAPNKAIPTGEAESQTKENLRKAGEGDGKGDPAPDGDADDAAAEAEAKTQTAEVTRKEAGDPAWEHKDAAMAEEASQMLERANGLVEEFEAREKEEAGSDAYASKAQAARAVVKSLEEILGATSTATKEIGDMDTEELVKLLDERDARKASELKKAKMKKEKKDKKKMPAMSDEEMAAKMATDPVFAAEVQKRLAKAALKAAKAGTPGIDAVLKQIESLSTGLSEVSKTVSAIAAQPQPTPMLNAAGLAMVGGALAVTRAGGPGGEGGASPFAALDQRVAKALESGDRDEYANAQKDSATARMIAFERLRAGGVSDAEATKRIQ